jgi:hypothetical protein
LPTTTFAAEVRGLLGVVGIQVQRVWFMVMRQKRWSSYSVTVFARPVLVDGADLELLVVPPELQRRRLHRR